MRIADSYFQTLLLHTPATEALHALSNEWAIRANVLLPNMGLSLPEYFVTLCLIYTGEVGNGGHQQFFLNRTGRYVADSIVALEAVGLPTARDILLRACQVFPSGSVPVDHAKVVSSLEQLPDSQLTLLEDLDRALWALSSDEALLGYLRTYAADVLLQERGLVR